MSKNNRNFKPISKALVIALLIVVVSILSSCSSGKTDSGIDIPAGMKVLREGDGYVCFVPTDWKLGSRFGVDYAYLDYYYCSVSISVTDTELTEPADAFNADLEHFRASFSDFELLTAEGETVTIGIDASYQYSGIGYTYKMTVDNVTNKYRQILAIRDGKLYILTYTAEAATAYDEYIDAFENIVADFYFTDSAKGTDSPIPLPDGSKVDTPSGMKLASNTQYTDYLLFVPETWTITAADGLSSAKAPSGGAVVNASAHSPGTTSTIADYFDNYIKKLEANLADIEVSERYEVTNEKDGEILRLDKAPAFRYTFTGKWMGTEYKFVQYIAISNSKMHYLTFSAPSETYDAHSAEFDSILESFRFE